MMKNIRLSMVKMIPAITVFVFNDDLTMPIKKGI